MKVDEMVREGSKRWLFNRCWLVFKKLAKDMFKEDWFRIAYPVWMGLGIIALASGIFWPVILIGILPFIPLIPTAYAYRDSRKWPVEWDGKIPNN